MTHFLSLITLTTVYFFSAGALGALDCTAAANKSEPECKRSASAANPNMDFRGDPLIYAGEVCKNYLSDAQAYEACKIKITGIDPCKELTKTALDEKKKLTAICAKANMGNIEQCKERAEECKGMEEDNADGVEQITAGLGVPSYTKKCPSSTDQPKTIKTDLKDKQKELNDLKKDMIKDEKDAADSFEKLQKEISDLQESYDKKNLEMDSDERKRQADATKGLQDLTAAIEANNAQMLDAQASLAGLEGKKAENLSNLSDAIIQTDCEAAVLKLAESLKVSSSGSSGGMIKQGAKKNQNLKLRYAQCIDAKNQARTSIITASQKETEKINFAIERLKADSARKQQALTQMQADAAKAVADAKTAKDVAAQKFASDKQRLTNKLQNLMSSTQKQTTNNQTRLTQLTSEVNKLSSELAMIGGGTITVNATFNEAISARSDYDSAVKNWGKVCDKSDKAIKGDELSEAFHSTK